MNASAAEQDPVVFPGQDWQTRTPEQAGMDGAKLAQFIELISSDLQAARPPLEEIRGCVIKDGYMVGSWGDPAKRNGWFSASKPVLSTLLFHAIDQGKLPGVDARIADLGWPLSDKDKTMTFRHLADMTGGYTLSEAPGTRWAYNDFGILLYAMSLEKVFGCTVQQKAQEFFGPLGLQDGSLIGKHLKGRGVATSPRDFARVGWFWMNHGRWGSQQLLPASYFEKYMHPDVPADLPRTAGCEPPDDYLQITSYGGGNNQTDVGPGMYGFNWWFNTPGPDGKLPFPDAPRDLVMAVGYSGNIMVMLPSQRLLAMGRAHWGEVDLPRRARLNQAIRLLVESVTATAPASATTQPAGCPCCKSK